MIKILADPILAVDRFDFSGEPLTEEDVEENKSSKSLTPDQKRIHWEAYANKTQREETSFQRTFRDVFQRQKTAVADAYARTGALNETILTSEEAVANDAKRFQGAIEMVYHSGFEDAAQGKTLKQLDETARTWIWARALKLVKDINTTTLEEIRGQLALGFEAGESIQQLTSRIVGYFEGNAQYRAERVSRTEVIAASNAGAQSRYETEGIQRKEWFAAPDARQSHLDANGQIVGVHDNFRVGDGEGPGPGQIGLPEEDINCRCTILPVLD